ncbi:MAG: CRISPR-associated RAMP protein Csx10 [Candidatus Promineifilaceae bacterium]
MQAITYHIELLEPTLIKALNSDPNSAVSFDYLPGSVLRGMLISRYRQRGKICTAQFDKALTVPDSPERRRFFSPHTRYLNGYLVDSLGNRSLPTPRSWQQDKKALRTQTKEQPAPVYDFAFSPPHDDQTEWKGAEKRFCTLASTSGVRLLSPKKQVAVHTTRERVSGRPQDAGIYRYVSLSPGQTFAAVILCADQDSSDLCELLEGEVKLGGARSGGYGLASLEVKKVEDAANWSETLQQQPLLQSDKIVLTLLSDVLVQDKQGQFVANREELLRLIDEELKSSEAFFAADVIGNFNQKWGLPSPQMVALSMGSVFICHYTGSKPEALAEKLTQLQQSGVGERRNEGFGRVAVNWYLPKFEMAVIPDSELQEDEIPLAPPIQSEDGRAIAKTMARRMFQQQLDEWNTAEANQLGQLITGPSKSQISRLRQFIQNALWQEPKVGRQQLARYFDSLEKRQKTRQQFQANRIEGRPLLEWLRFRVNDQSNIKDQVGEMPAIFEKIMPEAWSEELVYRSNLLLIDTVLARAGKLKKEEA